MKRGRTQQWVWNEGEQHLMPPMVFMTPSSPPPPTMIPTTHLLSSTCQKFSQSPPFKTKSKAPACLVKANLFLTMRETFKESPSAPAAATCWGIIHLKVLLLQKLTSIRPVLTQYCYWGPVEVDQYLPCVGSSAMALPTWKGCMHFIRTRKYQCQRSTAAWTRYQTSIRHVLLPSTNPVLLLGFG